MVGVLFLFSDGMEKGNISFLYDPERLESYYDIKESKKAFKKFAKKLALCVMQGAFFIEDLEETVLIAEKVLKKGTLNSKVRIIKIFTQIILRIIKQNDIICA
jgi:hypothetical protein